MTLGTRSRKRKSSAEIEIVNFEVSSAMRHSGIGTVALEKFLADAKERGCQNVSVYARYEAIGFWLKKNFTRERRKEPKKNIVNTTFMELKVFPPSLPLHHRQVIETFRTCKYVYIPGVVPERDCESLGQKAIEAYEDGNCHRSCRDDKGKRRWDVSMIMNKSTDLWLSDVEAQFKPIMTAILGEDCNDVERGVHVSLPDAEAQNFHSDVDADLQEEGKAYLVVLMVPLVDITEKNGGTEIESSGFINLGPKGSVLMFDACISHRDLPNNSEVQRPVGYLSYMCSNPTEEKIVNSQQKNKNSQRKRRSRSVKHSLSQQKRPFTANPKNTGSTLLHKGESLSLLSLACLSPTFGSGIMVYTSPCPKLVPEF